MMWLLCLTYVNVSNQNASLQSPAECSEQVLPVWHVEMSLSWFYSRQPMRHIPVQRHPRQKMLNSPEGSDLKDRPTHTSWTRQQYSLHTHIYTHRQVWNEFTSQSSHKGLLSQSWTLCKVFYFLCDVLSLWFHTHVEHIHHVQISDPTTVIL